MNPLDAVGKVFSFPDQFFDLFPDPEDEYSGSISIADVKLKPQVRYLFRYLNGLGCRSIFVENEYVDGDYLDDFAGYYVRCFSTYRRYCRRAHFWSELLDTDGLARLLDEYDEELLKHFQASYLGYSVIRPLPNAVIGKTIVLPWGSGDSQRHYTCLRRYKPHLFGLEFPIKSLAFQEQDTVLAACATTAIWSCLQKIMPSAGPAIFTPREITQAATKYIHVNRPLPSTGLAIEQICSAITSVGLAPEVYQVYPDTPLNSLIYSYVSMGWPVILGFQFAGSDDRHAVAVVGHRAENSQVHKSEVFNAGSSLPSVGHRISEFYVHDDGMGPFSRLVCSEKRLWEWRGPLRFRQPVNPRVFMRVDDDAPALRQECLPIVVIAPVRHKIRLRFDDVQGEVRHFDDYFRAVCLLTEQINNRNAIEWDIRLSTLANLKSRILCSDYAHTDSRLRILLSNQPRYLWLCTASASNIPLFTLVADATNIKRSFFFRDVLFHAPDMKSNIQQVLMHRDPDLEMAAQANVSTGFRQFLQSHFLS